MMEEDLEEGYQYTYSEADNDFYVSDEDLPPENQEEGCFFDPITAFRENLERVDVDYEGLSEYVRIAKKYDQYYQSFFNYMITKYFVTREYTQGVFLLLARQELTRDAFAPKEEVPREVVKVFPDFVMPEGSGYLRKNGSGEVKFDKHTYVQWPTMVPYNDAVADDYFAYLSKNVLESSMGIEASDRLMARDLNKQLQAASWLAAMLPVNVRYAVIGAGIGVMPYAMKKLGLNVVSYEPAQCGSMARKMGLIDFADFNNNIEEDRVHIYYNSIWRDLLEKKPVPKVVFDYKPYFSGWNSMKIYGSEDLVTSFGLNLNYEPGISREKPPYLSLAEVKIIKRCSERKLEPGSIVTEDPEALYWLMHIGLHAELLEKPLKRKEAEKKFIVNGRRCDYDILTGQDFITIRREGTIYGKSGDSVSNYYGGGRKLFRPKMIWETSNFFYAAVGMERTKRIPRVYYDEEVNEYYVMVSRELPRVFYGTFKKSRVKVRRVYTEKIWEGWKTKVEIEYYDPTAIDREPPTRQQVIDEKNDFDKRRAESIEFANKLAVKKE